MKVNTDLNRGTLSSTKALEKRSWLTKTEHTHTHSCLTLTNSGVCVCESAVISWGFHPINLHVCVCVFVWCMRSPPAYLVITPIFLSLFFLWELHIRLSWSDGNADGQVWICHVAVVRRHILLHVSPWGRSRQTHDTTERMFLSWVSSKSDAIVCLKLVFFWMSTRGTLHCCALTMSEWEKNTFYTRVFSIIEHNNVFIRRGRGHWCWPRPELMKLLI